ncbi:MAG: peptidylprolyl isomerase, partial [Myxococcota bacterium]
VAWRLLHKYHLVAKQPNQPAEKLLEEARELGLHENDVVVRRILAQRMRQLLQRDPAASISDAEIETFVARSDERFIDPATVSFLHVYLGDGETARKRLATARSGLDSGPLTAEQVEAASMPFPLGLELKAQTRPRLVGRFGQNFADEIFTLQPGGWHGPIESAYGEHLVQITDRRDEGRKSHEDLKRRALYDISRERSTQRVQTSLDWLRTLYRLRIEGEETEFMTGSGAGPGTRS